MTATSFGILLHRAVENGDISETERLLSLNGMDVDFRDSDGYTPLFKALRINRLDIAEILLENGADVNAEDNKGNTILINIIEMACAQN